MDAKGRWPSRGQAASSMISQHIGKQVALGKIKSVKLLVTFLKQHVEKGPRLGGSLRNPTQTSNGHHF